MKYLIFVLILIMSGCTASRLTVLSDKNELTITIVNYRCWGVIEIKGGAVNNSSVSVSITLNYSGLVWNPEEIKYSFDGEDGLNKHYHRIIISGIAKK